MDREQERRIEGPPTATMETDTDRGDFDNVTEEDANGADMNSDGENDDNVTEEDTNGTDMMEGAAAAARMEGTGLTAVDAPPITPSISTTEGTETITPAISMEGTETAAVVMEGTEMTEETATVEGNVNSDDGTSNDANEAWEEAKRILLSFDMKKTGSQK